jgi:hypothetical protein
VKKTGSLDRVVLLALAASLVACASRPATPTSLPTPTPAPPTATTDPYVTSQGGGEPRSAGYWRVWNSCAPDNKADVAAANGGREAGWILIDDLLADPGIQLGDHRVTSCEEGLALLEGRTPAGEEGGEIHTLAAALLTAELNLNAGAETCPAAEEAVLAGHAVLAQAGFDGPADDAEGLSDGVAAAVPRVVDLLEVYNRSELCR